ncbi:MAG: DUF1269 domain-containing protein [Chloroflexi bacterium]|nr:DUF1269 domain-containing protein [Chloroflexota bacterium]
MAFEHQRIRRQNFSSSLRERAPRARGAERARIQRAAEEIQPDASAIFVLVRKGDEEMVKRELERFAARLSEIEIDTQRVQAIRTAVDNLLSAPSEGEPR